MRRIKRRNSKSDLSNYNLLSHLFHFRDACNSYELLKNDESYKIIYKDLLALIEINHNIFKNRNRKIINSIKKSADFIKKHKGLNFPLNPNLKLSKGDLYSKNKKTIAKILTILYSFGYEINVPIESVLNPSECNLLSYFTRKSLRKSSKITKAKFDEEKKMLKLLIYTISNKMKIKDRVLSRFFVYDKNTIKKWCEEVTEWSEYEKNIILNEMITGKRLPNKELLDVVLSQKLSPKYT